MAWLHRYGSALVGLGLVAALSCSDERDARPDRDAGSPHEYRARVRWTSHGIPHFVASDMPSVAYASGYATSKDYVCVLAEQLVRLRSERAKYWGPGEMDENLDSDFGLLASGLRETALRLFPRLDPETRAVVLAYTAGYNRYLRETPPSARPLPCRDAAWVREIEPEDLWSYYYYLSSGPTLEWLSDYMAHGQPPSITAARARRGARKVSIGSNGWAIGRERSETGRGMLLANPHLPWDGPRRLYEQHITIPGELNAYGAGWIGLPALAIGFNEHLAWTYTASPAAQGAMYRLALAPGHWTRYVFEGEERDLIAAGTAIEVKQPDGTLAVVQRTLYRSHYGPMIEGFGAQWTPDFAHTYRSANDGNTELVRTQLAMARATSLAQLEAAQDTLGLSWVNVVAASADGTALYFGATRTPALSDAAEQAYRATIAKDYETWLSRASGLELFDGKTSLYDFAARDVRVPGVYARSDAPRLERSDFVANSNDSHWLTHPGALLTGFPKLFGDEATVCSARTRLNLTMLTERGETSPAGADGKFSFDELAAVPFGNRAILGEILRDAVVARCRANPTAQLGGAPFDVGPACAVLAAWDLRVDLDSPGAPLWREFLDYFSGAVGAFVFQDMFDPNDPLGTPRQLVAAEERSDGVLEALAQAVRALRDIGASESSTLADLQFTERRGERIPLHGGTNVEGAFNIVDHESVAWRLPPVIARAPRRRLEPSGYPVDSGASFLMVAELGEAGPRARTLLTYSQSADPESPNAAEQTRLFASKTWREVRFREADIAADPEFREVMVVGPRVP